MADKVEMGQVWDKTVAFVGEHRGAVVRIALVAILLPTVLAAVAQDAGTRAAGGVAILLALAGFVLTLVAFWGQLAVTALAAEPEREHAALAHATHRLPAVVGVSLVLLAALALLMLPAGAILAAYGVDPTAMSDGGATMPPAAGAWIALYVLVLAPVLLWLAARLLLVTPVVLEERRGLGAIGRSFALTRGLGAKLVGVLLLYAVVTLVSVSAARFVFGFLLALVAGGDGGITVASVLTAVVVSAVSTVLAVFQAGFVGTLYRTLVPARDAAAAFR